MMRQHGRPAVVTLDVAGLGDLDVTIEVGRYPCGGGTYVALNLPEPGGPLYGPGCEKLAIITTNIKGASEGLGFGEFTPAIDDAHDVIIAALEQAGYIERTGKRLCLEFNHDRADGRTSFPVWRLSARGRDVAIACERWDGAQAAPDYGPDAVVYRLQGPRAWIEEGGL